MWALAIVILVFFENLLISFIATPVRDLEVGSLVAPMGMNNEVPQGGISVLDFEKPIEEDISITSLQILSNANGNQVRLKVWRLKNDGYEVAIKTNLLNLTKGVNSFSIDNLLAKKGDYLGLYMQTSEIDRSRVHATKGRAYVVGDFDSIEKNTKAHDGQTGYTFLVKGKSCWMCQPSFSDFLHLLWL